jgi:hypothetical protein
MADGDIIRLRAHVVRPDYTDAGVLAPGLYMRIFVPAAPGVHHSCRRHVSCSIAACRLSFSSRVLLGDQHRDASSAAVDDVRCVLLRSLWRTAWSMGLWFRTHIALSGMRWTGSRSSKTKREELTPPVVVPLR